MPRIPERQQNRRVQDVGHSRDLAGVLAACSEGAVPSPLSGSGDLLPTHLRRWATALGGSRASQLSSLMSHARAGTRELTELGLVYSPSYWKVRLLLLSVRLP